MKPLLPTKGPTNQLPNQPSLRHQSVGNMAYLNSCTLLFWSMSIPRSYYHRIIGWPWLVGPGLLVCWFVVWFVVWLLIVGCCGGCWLVVWSFFWLVGCLVCLLPGLVVWLVGLLGWMRVDWPWLVVG